MNAQASNDTPGLMIPPPLMLAIAIVAAVILDWLTGLSFLAAPGPGSVQSWLGVVVTAAGLAVGGMGVREFRRGGTNVNPYEPALNLVTTGPYRYTRNPMYLGMVVMLLGVSLIFSLEWGVILTPLLWFALDRLIIAREESYLMAKFGDPYREFLGRTRRWL